MAIRTTSETSKTLGTNPDIRTLADVQAIIRQILTKLNLVSKYDDLDWTFSAANQEFQIPHSLDRVPVGYTVIRKTATADVYDSNTGKWSPTAIFLKSTQAGVTVRLRVF